MVSECGVWAHYGQPEWPDFTGRALGSSSTRAYSLMCRGRAPAISREASYSRSSIDSNAMRAYDLTRG